MQTTDIRLAATTVIDVLKVWHKKKYVQDPEFLICIEWTLKNLLSIILYWLAFIVLLPIVLIGTIIIALAEAVEGSISNFQEASYERLNDKLKALNEERQNGVHKA